MRRVSTAIVGVNLLSGTFFVVSKGSLTYYVTTEGDEKVFQMIECRFLIMMNERNVYHYANVNDPLSISFIKDMSLSHQSRTGININKEQFE